MRPSFLGCLEVCEVWMPHRMPPNKDSHVTHQGCGDGPPGVISPGSQRPGDRMLVEGVGPPPLTKAKLEKSGVANLIPELRPRLGIRLEHVRASFDRFLKGRICFPRCFAWGASRQPKTVCNGCTYCFRYMVVSPSGTSDAISSHTNKEDVHTG